MLTFEADQLLRALDVAAIPARLADTSLPILCTVALSATDHGLLAWGTDRYQVVRALAEYHGPTPGHGEGLPPVCVHRDGLKILLPVLKAARHDPVTLEGDADSLTVTVGAQTIRLDNANDERGFPSIASLFRLHVGGPEENPVQGCFTVNPRFMKALTNTLARYTREGETLTFSPDRKKETGPVAWMYGRWAHGLIMPIRLDRQRRIDNEADALARLFEAQPLMAPPGAASVRERTASDRTQTQGTPAKV